MFTITLLHICIIAWTSLSLSIVSSDGCVSIDSAYLIGVGYGGSLHLWSAQETEEGIVGTSEAGGGNGDITTTNNTLMKEGRKYGVHRVIDTSLGTDVSNNVTSTSQRENDSRGRGGSGSEHWSPIPFVTGRYHTNLS